jgi:hypothetical protein
VTLQRANLDLRHEIENLRTDRAYAAASSGHLKLV